jgi:histidyl-tRNA synthetase
MSDKIYNDKAIGNRHYGYIHEYIEIWYFIENEIKKIMNLCGFKEVRTSIVQSVDLYKNYLKHSKAYSKMSLDNLIYKLQSNDGLCLRPEGTLAILDTDVSEKAIIKPQKVFYQGPMFRKDVALQYHQVGVEIFGADNIISDIEILQLAQRIFTSIGLTNVVLEINSHGCKLCYPKYIEQLKEFLTMNPGELCKDCKTNIRKNPLSVYQCDNTRCVEFGKMAPKTIEHLCSDCSDSFMALKKLLANLGINFTINPYLIMHFDYYTKIVFNISVKDKENNKTIIARGGRFDSLAKYLTKLPLSAVGFSFNVDETIGILKETGIIPKQKREFSVRILSVDENMDLMVMQVANELHSSGICAIIEENIVTKNKINDFVKENKHNVYLIFREDLIREGKLMMIHNDFNNDKLVQDTPYLSDIMENITRTKKQINL